jgi:3-(methylthio)propanoyl-CoA dehydrogenase
MNFRAPLQDLLFNIQVIGNIAQLSQLDVFADANYDTARLILEECVKFNEQIIAPLNALGDKYPSQFNKLDKTVKTTEGFAAAFKQFSESGWQGLQQPIQYGGQGLPKLMTAACTEILNAANLSFALCPLLTEGAIEALLIAGSDAQKNIYLPKLISGQWTGTMNLTEPQAGSDLSAIRMQAIPQADEDNSYRLYGQKIYITYGEHDMAENIIHLVLARTPNAPEGVKGISLFIVPKYLVHQDTVNGVGDLHLLGKRNDVFCIGLEHKLGIKASPTATLVFGDNQGQVGKGAIAYLVGQEHCGLEYMFIMMNSARYAVGIQGIGLAQRAYQSAVDYAKSRVQGRAIGELSIDTSIIHHPDVRRMLMTMRALIEGCRAMALYSGAEYDKSHHHLELAVRHQSQIFYEFTVPLIKTYCTEMCIEVTHLAVQVYGGLGFIEGSDVAHYYRDAKILTIYEGTSAIQANDFISRKTLRDQGCMAKTIMTQIRCTKDDLINYGIDAQLIAQALDSSLGDFEAALNFILKYGKLSPAKVYAGSVPYTMLVGNVLAAWQLGRAALFALQNPQGTDTHTADFMTAKVATSLFYAQHILPRTKVWCESIINGADSTLALNLDAF